MPMSARQFMTREVVTVSPDTPVHEIALLLAEKGISGIPVLDGDTLVGLITEKDLIHRVKKIHIPTVFTILDVVIPLGGEHQYEEDLRKMAATTAEEIMNEDLIVVDVETDISEVATILSEENVSLLPVLEGNRLVGIIGKRDVIRAMLGSGDV